MKKTARIQVLCVLTELLGNKVGSLLLRDSLGAMDDVETVFLSISAEDYKVYSTPFWVRMASSFEARSIVRQKYRRMPPQDFDVLLVNCWDLVVEFRDLARRIPAAGLMLDAVPSNFNKQLAERGVTGWRRRVSGTLAHQSFQRAVRDYRFFLTIGSDCQQAIEDTYGIPASRTEMILPPQDLEQWIPPTSPRAGHTPLRLLFAGNDFLRKGGTFLLRLYTEYLRESCTLTLVSQDPYLATVALPEGVQWLRGRTRDQLLDVYQQHDLFVFPTKQDFMPQVLCEALATGLPCIANDVGSIRDVVRSGETGWLMASTAPVEQWASRIQNLGRDPRALADLSRGARQFAERHLDRNVFQPLLHALIRRLHGRSNLADPHLDASAGKTDGIA